MEAHQYLQRGKGLLAQGDYEGAFNENSKNSYPLPFTDLRKNEASFSTWGGFMLTLENPKKDYKRSIFFFKKTIGGLPAKPWSERAKILGGHPSGEREVKPEG